MYVRLVKLVIKGSVFVAPHVILNINAEALKGLMLVPGRTV